MLALVVALVLLLAAPASAADVFTVAGDGNGPLVPGALAGATDLSTMGMDVASDPRGGYAFTLGGQIWHVGAAGRLQPLGRTIGGRVERIVYGPDGTLFAGADTTAWRVSPDGLASAAASGLGRPLPVASDRDGGILIADGQRLLRLAPDNTQAVVAAGYGAIHDAAVTADGALVVATANALQEVAPVVRGLGTAPGAVAVLADGTVVETHGGVWAEQPWAWRVDSAVVHRPLFTRADLAGFDVFDGVNYLGQDDVSVEALDATPDGGLLVAANAGIHYLAPAQPGLLAVAIASARRSGPRSAVVRLRVSAPAATTVRLWNDDRLVARTDIAAGVVTGRLVARKRLAPAIYRVTAEAHAGPAAAAAQSLALIAPALPIAVTRAIVDQQVLYAAAYEDVQIEPGPCRRYGSRRVDCAGEVSGDCAGVMSMVWHRNGHVSWTMYGRTGGHCVISRSRGVDTRSRRRR